MSLTSFLNIPHVKETVKPLRPNLPRKIASPLKAEPLSNRYMLVGTAFDYLLRFELQRLAPHAKADHWIAEQAPGLIWHSSELGGAGLDILRDAAPEDYLPPEELAERIQRILADAKSIVSDYIESKEPTHEMRTNLSEHALLLAKLDSVKRARRLDPRFHEAAPEDVQDLLGLLDIVPFDDLLNDDLLILNPIFTNSGRLVGGADSDLIAGNLLVDFKTTKRVEMVAGDLDQLLGYLLLARKQSEFDPSFPVIERLGLYFARHGFLWTVDSTVWTKHPEFEEIESAFFRLARQIWTHGDDS